MAAGIPARLTRSERRRFALTLAVAFAALAALMFWRGHEIPGRAAAVLALGLAGAGVPAPAWLDGLYRAWMRLGLAMSKVTTPILLGVIFYGLILPTGVVMRMLGRRPLTHQPTDGSYWRESRSGGRSDLTHQF